MSTHPSSSGVIRTAIRDLQLSVDCVRYIVEAQVAIVDDAHLSGHLLFLLSDVERTVSVLVSALRGKK